MYKGIEIIAEVKPRSPLGFRSPLTWDELFFKAVEVGDIIAVHTHPDFGGSYNLISRARLRTDKPILAKGIHPTNLDYIKALDAGANYALVVGRVPESYDNRVWIEPNSLSELRQIPSGYRVVWNWRDLESFELGLDVPKDEKFEDARKLWGGWLCQASNIKTVADIKTGANAVLVGKNLIQFSESIKLLS